jgi:hypothetical protein
MQLSEQVVPPDKYAAGIFGKVVVRVTHHEISSGQRQRNNSH